MDLDISRKSVWYNTIVLVLVVRASGKDEFLNNIKYTNRPFTISRKLTLIQITAISYSYLINKVHVILCDHIQPTVFMTSMEEVIGLYNQEWF